MVCGLGRLPPDALVLWSLPCGGSGPGRELIRGLATAGQPEAPNSSWEGGGVALNVMISFRSSLHQLSAKSFPGRWGSSRSPKQLPSPVYQSVLLPSTLIYALAYHPPPPRLWPQNRPEPESKSMGRLLPTVRRTVTSGPRPESQRGLQGIHPNLTAIIWPAWALKTYPLRPTKPSSFTAIPSLLGSRV